MPCSLSYITGDDAIQEIMKTGPGTPLAKVDIKSAFRLLPMHPADRLLGIQKTQSAPLGACTYNSFHNGEHEASTTAGATIIQ